jgi:hypothetical protein
MGIIPSQQRSVLSKLFEKDFAKARYQDVVEGTGKDKYFKSTNDDGTIKYKKISGFTDQQLDEEFDKENAKKLSSGVEGNIAPKLKDITSVKDMTSSQKKEIRDLYKSNPTEFDISGLVDQTKINETDKSVSPEPISTGTETNKMGLATGLGLAQTAIGLAGTIGTALNKPDDYKLSEELRDAFGRAKEEAKYGLTPLEKSELEKDILGNRVASSFNIREASGGSSGTALAGELAVALNANKARLGVEMYDKQLKQQKQIYADKFIQPIMSESQFMYQNKMNQYGQDVQAWAGLAQTGIANTIGSLQYQGQMKTEEEIANQRNKPIFTT